MTEELLREWRSRTALMRRLATRDGEVAVKIPWYWSESDAVRVAAAHNRWNQLLRELPGVDCPRAVASADPPAVTMPFIAGTHLSAVIRRGEETTTLLHRAGQALAALHEEADPQVAADDARATRRRLLLPPGPTQAIRSVRSAGDYSPYNMIVDKHGHLHLIDVEPAYRAVTAHRDIAWFLDWYEKSGGKDPAAFMVGYESQARRRFDADDRRLVATFLTRISVNEVRKGPIPNVGGSRKASAANVIRRWRMAL